MSHIDLSSALPSDLQISRASVASFHDGAGKIKAVASGAARFGHDNATMVARGLLIEEADENYVGPAEDFGDASWTKDDLTVTINDATSPLTGLLDADKLVENSDTGQVHKITDHSTATMDDNTVMDAEIVVKAAGRNWIRLDNRNKANQTVGVYFNLSDGTIGTASGGVTGIIADLGDGWYNCTNRLNIGTGSAKQLLQVILAEANNDVTYDGDGSSGIHIWGAQLRKQSSSLLSYIPDKIIRPTDDVTFVNPAQWSSPQIILVEFYIPYERTVLSPILEMTDAGGNNKVEFNYGADQKWHVHVTTAGILVADLESAVDVSIIGTHKAAICISRNNFGLVMDASVVNLSDVSGGTPLPFTAGYLGQNAAKTAHLNGNILHIQRLAGNWPISQAQLMVA